MFNHYMMVYTQEWIAFSIHLLSLWWLDQCGGHRLSDWAFHRKSNPCPSQSKRLTLLLDQEEVNMHCRSYLSRVLHPPVGGAGGSGQKGNLCIYSFGCLTSSENDVQRRTHEGCSQSGGSDYARVNPGTSQHIKRPTLLSGEPVALPRPTKQT